MAPADLRTGQNFSFLSITSNAVNNVVLPRNQSVTDGIQTPHRNRLKFVALGGEKQSRKEVMIIRGHRQEAKS